MARIKRILRVHAAGDRVRKISKAIAEGMEISILNADVSPDSLTAEIAVTTQDPDHLKDFVETLKEYGLEVKIVEKTLTKDDDLCLRCTACRAVCPVDAIVVTEDMLVEVDDEKCIACASCVEACPTGALRVERVEGEPT